MNKKLVAITAAYLMLAVPILIYRFACNSDTEYNAVVVEIKGEVQFEGLYTLPENSRVNDVVKLAQATVDADLDTLNLAKKLEKYETIIVGRR